MSVPDLTPYGSRAMWEVLRGHPSAEACLSWDDLPIAVRDLMHAAFCAGLRAMANEAATIHPVPPSRPPVHPIERMWSRP